MGGSGSQEDNKTSKRDLAERGSESGASFSCVLAFSLHLLVDGHKKSGLAKTDTNYERCQGSKFSKQEELRIYLKPKPFFP